MEHIEVSGARLVYPQPDAKTAAFLEHVARLADAHDVSPEAIRALVFGPENPILARHPTLPGAYPDAATVRNPVYWVCVDLVLRAEARGAHASLERAGAPFTMTMAEAAKKLGRYQHAVQNAVKNRTLHVWVHDGRHYLLPAEVAAYDVPRRGRPPKKRPT